MEENMNEGLGMIPGAQQAPVQEEKYISKPNIALERYNNNIVNDIRNQAKQEAIQEIAHEQAVNQEMINRERGALDYGRNVGREEGLGLGAAIARGSIDPLSYGDSENENFSSERSNYGNNDSMNNEMDYVDNSWLGRL